jgi:uncharacterized protein YjbI with pentapeptide repeats
METRTIRDRKFLLPDPHTEGLDECDAPPTRGQTLSEVTATDADWGRAQLEDATITHSVLTRVNLAEARITGGRLSAATFTGVDFASSRWDATKIDRCVFTGCTFVGANLADVSAENLIFEDCRFDYAYLHALRAVGGVAFVRCAMRETSFEAARLLEAVFADCMLTDTEFNGCDLRGADVRGSNLDQVQGVVSFRETVLDTEQLSQLATALVRDFELVVASRQN